MKNTIIGAIVAVLCTAAICVTYAVKAPTKNDSVSVADGKAYMTEVEAADYLGVSEEIMQMLREDLKKLEGSYVSYYYTDAKGNEVNSIVYNKEALDDVMKEIMSSEKENSFNFKYLQQIKEESK